MIKVSNHYLNAINESNQLINDIKQKSFSIKNSYGIALFFQKIIPYIQAFIDAKQNLINKYGVKDKGGELIVDQQNNTIKLNNPDQFMVDIKKLMDMEVTIDCDKIIFDSNHEPCLTISEIELLMPIMELKT